MTQALQFMDKTALNYANLFQYQTALNLKGLQFNVLSGGENGSATPGAPESWQVLTILYATAPYIGYFFGMYPATYLIGRFKAQYVLGASCLLWGFMVIILSEWQIGRISSIERSLTPPAYCEQPSATPLLLHWWFAF